MSRVLCINTIYSFEKEAEKQMRLQREFINTRTVLSIYNKHTLCDLEERNLSYKLANPDKFNKYERKRYGWFGKKYRKDPEFRAAVLLRGKMSYFIKSRLNKTDWVKFVGFH